MNLAPGRIVPDGDAGSEIEPAVAALGAEIDNFAAHYHRVRYRHDVILTGEDLGRQDANLADLSLIVSEADPVAFTQRPGVD